MSAKATVAIVLQNLSLFHQPVSKLVERDDEELKSCKNRPKISNVFDDFELGKYIV